MSQPLAQTLTRILEGENVTLTQFLYDVPVNKEDQVNGSCLWKNLSKSTGYYLYQEEKRLVDEFSSSVGLFAKNISHFIDLAPGTKEAVLLKTLPILKACKKLSHYSSIDITKKFAEESSRAISQKLPEIKVEFYVGDIFENFAIKGESKTLTFLSGATIGNNDVSFSDDRECHLTLQLEKIKSSLRKSTYFLVTQDTTTNIFKLREAYSTKYCESLIMNIFHRIKRDLSLQSFDPEAFSYESRWNPDIHAIEMFGVSTKSQTLLINGNHYEITQGSRIPVARSYKLPSELFISKAESTGFSHIKTFKCKGSGVCLHLFELQQASIAANKKRKAA